MGAIATLKRKVFGRLEQVEQGLGSFVAEVTGIETQHAELGREKDGHLLATETQADLDPVALKAVVAFFEARRAALAPAVIKTVVGGVTWEPDGSVRRHAGSGLETLAGLSALDWAALREDPARLAADLVRLAPVGPSIEERLARIAAIDRECERLEGEHAALVDAAAALTPPIVLAHLPAVAARRRAEANAAARAAHERADAEYNARVGGRP
jgi:hypothetical protein